MAGTTFATRTEAEHAPIHYLDGWYNPRRIQAKLGGLSPDEYEDTYHRAQRDTDRYPVLRRTGEAHSTNRQLQTGRSCWAEPMRRPTDGNSAWRLRPVLPGDRPAGLVASEWTRGVICDDHRRRCQPPRN
ncbi:MULTISPECIES: IS3 family transposase [unclassified Pseudonocardia]|uniref:IS3 family transposase n=1 Tax=unclassified Pseudonocardia TaxID=2619320 RepID=UPI0032E410D2